MEMPSAIRPNVISPKIKFIGRSHLWFVTSLTSMVQPGGRKIREPNTNMPRLRAPVSRGEPGKALTQLNCHFTRFIIDFHHSACLLLRAQLSSAHLATTLLPAPQCSYCPINTLKCLGFLDPSSLLVE